MPAMRDNENRFSTVNGFFSNSWIAHCSKSLNFSWRQWERGWERSDWMRNADNNTCAFCWLKIKYNFIFILHCNTRWKVNRIQSIVNNESSLLFADLVGEEKKLYFILFFTLNARGRCKVLRGETQPFSSHLLTRKMHAGHNNWRWFLELCVCVSLCVANWEFS